MSKKILVVGTGSVGKRHLANLAELGCLVWGVDPRPDRLAEAAGIDNFQDGFSDLEAALEAGPEFDGAVVASPPSFHVDQCLALARAGLPILLEKPVCPTLEEGQRLARELEPLEGTRLLLGYTYRWWPPLADLKAWLEEGRIGKPLHAVFYMSAHLADWHPWERYQDFFMASQELGGGALLDESHFLDLMYWFFGLPEKLFGRVEKLSGLEIETDDNVDLTVVYANGLRVSVHLDLFGRPHEKYIVLTGEKGTIHWSFEPNQLKLGRKMEQEWEAKEYSFERNDMFVALAREFLEVIEGREEMTCTLADGLEVLRIIEACRTSSATERMVAL